VKGSPERVFPDRAVGAFGAGVESPIFIFIEGVPLIAKVGFF